MPLNEFEAIAQYFARLTPGGTGVNLGVGDDCALLQATPGHQLAISIDTLVAGRHFPESAKPYDIATRAFTVSLSDLAAMGAQPRWFTLALTLPEMNTQWLKAFSRGLADMADLYQCALVGGDTTKGPLTITLQVHGELPNGLALKRSGAKVGDAIYLSGPVGDGACALAAIMGDLSCSREQNHYLHQRFYAPEPQIALGRQILTQAHSAIDISDGLLADLNHIAKASGVGMQLQLNELPLSSTLKALASQEQALQWALRGGDDYQLAFTGPGNLGVGYCIGRVVDGAGVECFRGDECVELGSSLGYQHF